MVIAAGGILWERTRCMGISSWERPAPAGTIFRTKFQTRKIKQVRKDHMQGNKEYITIIVWFPTFIMPIFCASQLNRVVKVWAIACTASTRGVKEKRSWAHETLKLGMSICEHKGWMASWKKVFCPVCHLQCTETERQAVSYQWLFSAAQNHSRIFFVYSFMLT